MQNPFIMGEGIYLRGLERDDLKNMVRWADDAEVTYYMVLGAFPGNIEALEKEYEQTIHSRNDVTMAVINKENDVHIGNVGLYAINWIARSAEFRIIIGEKDTWNKGYGTEATGLCVTYGFAKLNLNRIWLGTNAANKGAVRCYEKAGFKHEGILRQEQYRHGVYFDAMRMSILREDYDASQKDK